MAVNQANYVYRMGTAPNTHAAVSQKNKVYGYTAGLAQFTQLGALSEFGMDESRSAEPYRGVGYGDQIAELVPNVTEPMSLTVNKTLLYTANLFQLFGYKGGVDGLVRSLRHHRWPFDIKQELVFSEIASGASGNTSTSAAQNASVVTTISGGTTPIKCLFTIFEGCWMNSYQVSFTSDAALVAENSSITVSDVIDGTSSYGEYYDSGLQAGESTAGATSSLRFSGQGASTTAGTGT